jgi:hypothetical protein
MGCGGTYVPLSDLPFVFVPASLKYLSPEFPQPASLLWRRSCRTSTANCLFESQYISPSPDALLLLRLARLMNRLFNNAPPAAADEYRSLSSCLSPSHCSHFQLAFCRYPMHVYWWTAHSGGDGNYTSRESQNVASFYWRLEIRGVQNLFEDSALINGYRRTDGSPATPLFRKPDDLCAIFEESISPRQPVVRLQVTFYPSPLWENKWFNDNLMPLPLGALQSPLSLSSHAFRGRRAYTSLTIPQFIGWENSFVR